MTSLFYTARAVRKLPVMAALRVGLDSEGATTPFTFTDLSPKRIHMCRKPFANKAFRLP